jgi:hypothetical protein
MSKYSDQVLAKKLLASRQRHFSYGLLYRANWKICALLFALASISIYQILSSDFTWPAWLALGFSLGAAARDLGWFRVLLRTKSFNDKTTDWEKVQRLADGETTE